jgi:hypothetical protein
VIHVHLLAGCAYLLGMYKTGGLKETFVATLLVLLVLYPLCRWYGRLKKTRSWKILRDL